MGGDIPVYSAKNILEVTLGLKFPLDFLFIAYLLNSNYEKSAEYNPTFRRDNFFPLRNSDKPVSKKRC